MSLVHISGSVGGVMQNLTGNSGSDFQRIVINIPARKKLKIKKIMYYIAGDWFRIGIEDHPDLDKWLSASSEGEETPNHVLWQNINNVPFKLGISIMIFNIDTVDHPVQPWSGWSIVLSIE